MGKPRRVYRRLTVQEKVRLAAIPHDPILNKTEQMFVVWAEAQGWSVTKRGWPDFICRRGDEIMAVEVKGGNDGVRPEQAQTLRDLKDAGLPTYVWWPERGLLTVGGTTESIATLRAANARLMQTLAEVIGMRDRVASLKPPAHRSAAELGDRLTVVLVKMSNRCIEHHPEHQEWYTPPPGQLAFCGWLLQLSMRLTEVEIIEVTGVGEHQIKRLLPRLQRIASRLLNAPQASAA